MAKRVVTFGEIMMRLNPVGYKRLIQADSLEVSFAGGEANVAVSLANFGVETAFVTKIPNHEIGQSVIRELRKNNVDTNLILLGGSRLGVYYVEKGFSQRPSKVIYDRAHSSIAEAMAKEFDWDTIFAGVDWFHWTGITPALSIELQKACLDACKAAQERGITVSCDLNYRKKLWSREEACTCMSQLMTYVDLCIANEEDAKDIFSISAQDSDIDGGKLNYEGYIDVARKINERFGCKKVAITLRSSISADENDWAGMLYEDGRAFFSPTYRVHIIDRVGGGDSFCGGLIYSQLEGYSNQEAIDFAVAASCLKHSIEHDFNLVCLDEVRALAAGNVSGRVQR